MEIIVLFLVLVTGFIALDLGSVRFGADSGSNCPIPTSAKQRLTSLEEPVNTYYDLLALDLASERSREIEELRLARLVREGRDQRGESYDWLPAPDFGPVFAAGSLERRLP